jgi:hypothetical protein
MKKLLAIASAAILFVGCTPSERKLTVINASSSTLTNIVASGTGFSMPFGSLAPSAQQQVTVSPRPRDNPGLKLDFDANGKHFSEALQDANFSGFKEIVMTVTKELSVTYESVTTF